MKKYTLNDWAKSVVFVLAMVNWIIASSLGFIGQLLGLMGFIAGFFMWSTSKHFIDVLKWFNENFKD
jgi:small basic protein